MSDAADARPDTPKSRLARLFDSPAALKIAGGLFILVAWELVVQWTAPAYVAKPSNMIPILYATLTSREMLEACGTTLWAVIEGLLISLAAGVIFGLAMGQNRFVDRFLQIYVNGLYAMPMIAILPLLTIWFGYSSSARLATIVFAAFFPIAIQVRDGARAAPREYMEVARAYRARWHHIWFGITLPAAMPYLVAGLQLAVGRALVGAVVAEFFISIDGLGFYILFNSRTFHHNKAMIAVLLFAAFAVGVQWLMDFAMRRFLPWYRAGERH
ncbi:MAG TPA: ABC transporter permease [Alphaproteobacteria bacterium]|nr:ABC transporter permease [Alphaproteobacteria bacterium]